jgi:hypothetical protein
MGGTPEIRLKKMGGWNLYGYVRGDPINSIDLLGPVDLPAEPSGLPPEWLPDPSHKAPNGQTRYWNPNSGKFENPNQPNMGSGLQRRKW